MRCICTGHAPNVSSTCTLCVQYMSLAPHKLPFHMLVNKLRIFRTMYTCSSFNTELCPLVVGVHKSNMNAYLLFQIVGFGGLSDI